MKVRHFILSLALMAACTAGPESPGPYRRFGPVTTLSFNFKDLPAHDEIVSAPLFLSSVNFRRGVDPSNKACDEPGGGGVLESFVAEGAKYHLQTASMNPEQPGAQDCIGGYPDTLHFFKAYVEVLIDGTENGFLGSLGTWAPGPYDLVYAHEATVFRPISPTGPAVTIPEGYSWLHRPCGAGGNPELSIVAISDTIDLYRSPGLSLPRREGSPTPTEIIEGEMAAACGGLVPSMDLGTRVSFDRAKELGWSADGTRIFYLSRDPEEPDGMGGLRQVSLSELTTSEIAMVRVGAKLQTGAASGLYVTDAGTIFAVSLSPGTPATLQALPFAGAGHLSPDGLWFAYDGADGVHVWSVAAAAEAGTIPGGFAGWSPDSRLLTSRALPTDPSLLQLFVVSPRALDRTKDCGTLETSWKGELVWPADCPVVAYAPLSWSVESTNPAPACENCFGVSLRDPVMGSERQILDPSAGMVHLAESHPVAGVAFAWARTCRGLYNMVCSFALLRIRLADGTLETVATADQELPVALSWDNQRLALAASNGIYVKELPQ